MQRIFTPIKQLFSNTKFAFIVWMLLPLAAAIKQVLLNSYGNYYVYKYSFINIIHQKFMYLIDANVVGADLHYGPFFSFIIAPFSLFPDWIGVILWVLFNAFILYWAVSKLELTQTQKNWIYIICAHELMTSSFNVQFNPFVAAMIVLSYVFIRKEKDFWAACCIAIGLFTKLYGIVGVAFFFFSQHKIKFSLSLLFWSIVCFCIPMLYSSPDFVIQSYLDWKNELVMKNARNITGQMNMQNISAIGMIQRIGNFTLQSNWIVIVPALIFSATACLNFKAYEFKRFQQLMLASVLLFVVLFSTGSESCTYIIAMIGVGIWFVGKQKRNILDINLLILAMILTVFSPSDLFPRVLYQTIVLPFALKALPCFLIWIKIIFEMWFIKSEDNLVAES